MPSQVCGLARHSQHKLSSMYMYTYIYTICISVYRTRQNVGRLSIQLFLPDPL